MGRSRATGRRWALSGALAALSLVLTACAPQAPSQPRPAPAATSSQPACAEVWCTVMEENFDRSTPLGSFAAIYGKDFAGYPDGHADTSGNGQYWPSKVLSVEDGALDWWVHTEGSQFMTAAPLPQGYQGQRWGRWTVRFRSDEVEQAKLAFLLWSVDDEWSDGEVDFPEGELGEEIYGYSHNVEGNPAANQFKFSTSSSMKGWHTAEIEWTPEHLKFTLDGKKVKSTTDVKALPQVPLRWVLQVESSLEGPKPKVSAEGHVQVDWVKIESYNP